MIFAAVSGVLQLTVLGSFTRTVQVRTVFGAIGTGFYACATVAAGLQWGVTRLAASLFGVGLDGVVVSAGFTINPFIEELVKVAPLLAAGWWLRSKQQWGATDFVLMASGFGAGFGLFEAFGRYGQFLSKFTAAPGGYLRANSFFPPFIPNLSGTIFSWIPAPVTKVDVSAVEPDVAPHIVWSSIAGLGIGLFFKTKTRFRILALLLVAVAGVDHAVWNYQATEPLLNAGFYDTYGTSLIEPLTNIFQPARPAFWIWPLLTITTATIIDITTLRRTRPNLARYIRIEPTLTQRFASNTAYAKLKPFWTVPIIWRYALAQRSASYSLHHGSGSLANALTTDHQFLQQTNSRNAWRPTTLKTIWTQHRQDRPIKPAQILLFGIWLLLLTPTFIYFIIGGNPQTGTQEQFYGLTPLRIAIGTLTIAMLWIGWQTLTSLQTLRRSRTQPTNTITIAAFHRTLTGITTIAFSLVLLNIYRTTDPFSPAQQPLTYNAHVLTIAAILFLIAAVLLITAAIILFPPSTIAFSAAFAGTGTAAGLTITLGGPVGASAAATAAAIASTGAAAYTYDQAQQQKPDRYQPDQNTNRNRTEQTNEYDNAKAVDSVEESADTAAGHLDDQTGKTFEETKETLEEAGFEQKDRTPGGYDKFYHPDGSRVWIRPNGEIVRIGPKVNNPDPNLKGYPTRLDQHGNPGAPHNTGEKVIR